MKINYISSLVSQKTYKSFYKTKKKPGTQAQKFNRIVKEGFELAGNQVDCYSVIPVSKELLNKTFVNVPNDNEYHYFPVINIPLLKDIVLYFRAKNISKQLIKENENCIFICDVLSISNSLATSIICKKAQIPCVSIVTDLPEFVSSNSLYNYLIYKTINNCSHYVLLAEPMNHKVNSHNKPYCVIEGFADSSTTIEYNHSRKKYIMYAGSIDAANGIDSLVQGYLLSNIEYELHIYGTGDYESKLREIAKNNVSIHFYGLVPNEIIIEKLKEASFVINPRPISNEFTKYSFPSKNMEYLASGTPFICTRLECIPHDYDTYINYIKDDSTDGIASFLKQIVKVDYNTLQKKALNAQEYVLKFKNNKVQAQKIINLVLENPL